MFRPLCCAGRNPIGRLAGWQPIHSGINPRLAGDGKAETGGPQKRPVNLQLYCGRHAAGRTGGFVNLDDGRLPASARPGIRTRSIRTRQKATGRNHTGLWLRARMAAFVAGLWPTWIQGRIVPVFDISAGSSGMAFIGASGFDDADFLKSLRGRAGFCRIPFPNEGRLKYYASNQVGDAALLYAATLGPLWAKVRREARP